ncbi:MAG: response regulator [Hyphomonadaceae bacterium]
MPDTSLYSAEESKRREALRRLDLLNAEPDPFFDDLIELVQMTCAAPIALVSLTDVDRQWFKVKRGIDLAQLPRKGSLCAYVVESGKPLVIDEAQTHPLSHDSPLVTGPTHIAAYAGAPIILSDGNRIGTVCALDTTAHAWDDRSVACLQRAARMVASHAEARATYAELAASSSVIVERAASTARHRSIINAMSEGVVVHDADGSIIECNEAACRILGLTDDQLRGRTSRDPRWTATDEAGTPLEPEQHPAMIVLATGRPARNTIMRVSRPDSETRFLMVSAVPLPSGGEDSKIQALATFIDVTERISQQHKLNDLLLKTEAESQAKSEFLAAMSHEIRTPLNGLLGVSQHLARRITDPSLKQSVALLRRSGLALKDIVDDALDIDRIELGALRIKRNPFDLHELLSEVASTYESSAHEKGLVLDRAWALAEPCILIGDDGRIRQILNNLLSNAVKFTPSGSIRLAAVVCMRDRSHCDLEIEVRDTGRGISANFSDTLFAKFEREVEDEETAGAGLGLYLAMKLARLMGGDLVYVANEPSGAVFKLSLSLETGALEDLPAPQEEPSPPTRLRVLVAEDHAVNREIFSLLFEPFDMDVTFVTNGPEALASAKQNTFDLILMDRQMPGLSGVDVTQELRFWEQQQNAPRTAVLFVSADGSPTAIQQAGAAGADGYLTKPIVVDALMREINRVLAVSQTDQSSDKT